MSKKVIHTKDDFDNIGIHNRKKVKGEIEDYLIEEFGRCMFCSLEHICEEYKLGKTCNYGELYRLNEECEGHFAVYICKDL
ncbi:MAG: hypothetical protein ACRC23_02040 [Aeromonas jandaei]